MLQRTEERGALPRGMLCRPDTQDCLFAPQSRWPELLQVWERDVRHRRRDATVTTVLTTRGTAVRENPLAGPPHAGPCPPEAGATRGAQSAHGPTDPWGSMAGNLRVRGDTGHDPEGIPRCPGQGCHTGHRSCGSPMAPWPALHRWAQGTLRPARHWGGHGLNGATRRDRQRCLSDPDSRVRDGCDPPWPQGCPPWPQGCLPALTTNLRQPRSRPTGEMAKGGELYCKGCCCCCVILFSLPTCVAKETLFLHFSTVLLGFFFLLI